jgi:hypothetical protein
VAHYHEPKDIVRERGLLARIGEEANVSAKEIKALSLERELLQTRESFKRAPID